jgi:hypothetical protein
MSAPTVSTVEGAIGQSPKRVEDDRFIRGMGNYVDDVQLPGMLHMAIYRSPFAHAGRSQVRQRHVHRERVAGETEDVPGLRLRGVSVESAR